MDALSRYAYGLLYERWLLSSEHIKFCDEQGPFVIFSQGALAAEMQCTLKTVRRCLEDLQRAGLITQERTGGANRVRLTPLGTEKLALKEPIDFEAIEEELGR